MTRVIREEVFSPDEIACVHVMNRAVRRCFLMGYDPVHGKNFDHRKQWIEQKLQVFASGFAIDLLGYAILDNHFHLVLRSRPDVVRTWDDRDVAIRWLRICPLRKNHDGTPKEPSDSEIASIVSDGEFVAQLRRRLSDISWWMRLLCQYVGQRANREMDETGRFWESRFRAVRLLDDSALLAAVAYVDLNPIRAALAQTVETSEHTSAKKRIESLLKNTADVSDDNNDAAPDAYLAPVQLEHSEGILGPQPAIGRTRCSDKGFLDISAAEYLTLLDQTARLVSSPGRGSTPAELAPIVERVGLQPATWLGLVSNFGELFHNVAGSPHQILQARSRVSRGRYRVREQLRALFSAKAS